MSFHDVVNAVLALMGGAGAVLFAIGTFMRWRDGRSDEA